MKIEKLILKKYNLFHRLLFNKPHIVKGKKILISK